MTLRLSILLLLSRGKTVFLPMTCVTDNLCVENARFLLPVSCAVCFRNTLYLLVILQTCQKASRALSLLVGLTATQCLSPPHVAPWLSRAAAHHMPFWLPQLLSVPAVCVPKTHLWKPNPQGATLRGGAFWK